MKAATSIFDFVTGRDLTSLIENFHREDLLKDIKENKEIHTLFNDLVDAILNEQGNRLIVFIDELDRCKPDFAVRLLERIKHYFTNERITFVFAVNIEELQYTIKRYYGEGFDACRYLDRFFDLHVMLKSARMDRFYQKLGFSNIDTFERVCKAVIEEFDFGIREIEKYIRTVKAAAYKSVCNTHTGFNDGNGKFFARCFIVPIVIGLKMADSKLYEEFINGRNPQPLINIIDRGDFDHLLASLFLSRRTMNDNGENTIVTLADLLKDAYGAIFKNNGELTSKPRQVGQCEFDSYTKKDILELASLLSNQAEYSD